MLRRVMALSFIAMISGADAKRIPFTVSMGEGLEGIHLHERFQESQSVGRDCVFVKYLKSVGFRFKIRHRKDSTSCVVANQALASQGEDRAEYGTRLFKEL
ncbi:MAG: hypothetical protein ACKVT2_16275, partial [Saprospiraceae bacterium]